jgi:metal-responsive CopG/Arc/MetJ family transcriptional regulator
MKKIKRIVNYNLDDARCEVINQQREKLLNEYERLIPIMEKSKGWDKVDYKEKMMSISDELSELNDEYESLTFCTIDFE